MPKMFVVADYHSWMTPAKHLSPGRMQHNTARRGEVIDVDEDEAARGVAIGSLSASEGDLVKAEAEAGELRAWGDEQLRGANRDELIAYMGQRPSEVERVRELEEKRSSPRKTVLEAAERIAEARDAELERQAAATADEAAVAAAVAGGAPRIPANG